MDGHTILISINGRVVNMKNKQNTDIGDFKITKLPTVNENISLSSMGTRRSYLIEKYKRARQRRHRSSQVRIGRLIKSLEED
jgi:hypothetical protein